MKECKYRLPCNWCDKFDKFCDMSESIEIKLPDANTCDHDWMLYKTVIHTGGEDYHSRCRKCGAMMVESGEVIYESGEWQP
jgi:hypothetical protein